jgi:hypothetical protein
VADAIVNRTSASEAGGKARPARRIPAKPDAQTTSVTAIAAISVTREEAMAT